MLGRIQVVPFEGPDIPGGALRALRQLSVNRSGIGEEDVIRGMLIHAGQVKLPDIQIAVRARPVVGTVSAPRAQNGIPISVIEEEGRAQAGYPKDADALQTKLPCHETLADVQKAVITSAARQSETAIGTAD